MDKELTGGFSNKVYRETCDTPENGPINYVHSGLYRQSYHSEMGFKAYVGTKIVAAKPMDRDTFTRSIKGADPDPLQENEAGFLVEYPDGYKSWSPFKVFTECYREISDDENGFKSNAHPAAD